MTKKPYRLRKGGKVMRATSEEVRAELEGRPRALPPDVQRELDRGRSVLRAHADGRVEEIRPAVKIKEIRKVYEDAQAARDKANAPPFKCGDVVRLKSGGHRMTVHSTHECGHKMTDVAWSHDGKVHSDELFTAMLELAPDDPDIPF